MKLWSKTLIASAVCLFLAGCDDSSKVDANLDKAKDNAQQIKEAASDKADAIKVQEAGKIKDSAIVDANNLANDAANKTKEIKESIAPAKTAEDAANANQQTSH